MSARSLSIANRHPRLRLNRRELAAAVSALDSAAQDFLGGCPPGDLSLVFLTDEALARLHAEFLSDPTPTDVITFSGDPFLDIPATIGTSATLSNLGGTNFYDQGFYESTLTFPATAFTKEWWDVIVQRNTTNGKDYQSAVRVVWDTITSMIASLLP